MFVKSRVPVLAPLLRSDAQGELLALLLLHPESEYTLTEIARRIGVSLPTVHAEVARLVVGGLVTDRRVGQARLVRAVTGHVLFRPLAELLELTYGPVAVLPDVLAGVGGVREVYLYGSWAARRAGEPGDPPRDVDVLVVGATPRDVLLELGERAGRRLHREVNVTRVAPKVWDAGEDPFVRTLKSRPLIPVPLVEDGQEVQA
ncbi:MAG TPA: helix-turn-helix domain-containing protein [Kineosporiaceae bacterium]|nr:helix-turn-helix domain-containing protein [Kineosporiaceae bacterium]